MKLFRYSIGIMIALALIAGFATLEISLFNKWIALMLIGCFFALFRVVKGPTLPDRATALTVLGVIVTGLVALLSLSTAHDSIALDIALAWALQLFIGIIAIAKYLEGRSLDD
jgi:multicomponent Na+:H+ antiporter subunit F